MFLLFLVFLLTQATEEVFSSLDPDLPQHCLKAHNEYRSRHKSPKLTWSVELADQAQNWANHLAEIDQMERDSSTKDGENIFFMYGGDPAEACDRAVENWYSEVRNYDFKKPHESPSTDHFSQIVWKNTKELGVGAAQSKSGNFFLVARYNPSGNTGGTFQDNVESASDVPVSKDHSESTLKTSSNDSSSARETSTRPTTPTVASSTPVSVLTKVSTASNSGGNHFAIPEPVYEDEISKTEPREDEKQFSEDRLGDAEIKLQKLKLQKLEKDKFSPGADMLMAPPKYGKDYQVEIRFPDIEFTNKMEYSSSTDFVNMKLAITSAIMQLYEDRDEFLEVQLLGLRNGSVIATIGLIFSKAGHNYLDSLTEAVADGKLGNMVVSRDYVKTDVVPDGFLRLTLPHQPLSPGQCPQPCSNPTHCFKTGCHVDCCSYPSSSSSSAPAQATAPPYCPGNCPSTCYPLCTNECCSDKMAPQTVSPQASHMTSTVSPVIDYSQCHASCPVTCMPECTPQCCFAPATEDLCSDDCADFCSTECPQECCAKKSDIHSQQFGRTTLSNFHYLPPLHHDTRQQSVFMYGSKNRALRNPTKHTPKVFRPSINRAHGYNRNTQSSYWKPYLKLAASYGYRPKDGALRNTIAPKHNTLYTHPTKTSTQQRRAPYSRQPSRSLKAHGQTRYGTRPTGIRFIKDLKSKGAPVDIRYAYRYGDRLLVPIDLPKSMDIKEMRGKKFISVPAFKRGNIARNARKRKTL